MKAQNMLRRFKWQFAKHSSQDVWNAPATILASHILAESHLADKARMIIPHALGAIEEFYRRRTSRTCNGTMMNVSASPIAETEGRKLLSLAVQENVQQSLETGMAFGMSTCHLLLAMQITGGKSHIAIDPFQMESFYQGCGLMNVYQMHLGAAFKWLAEPSHLALPMLLRSGTQIDMCFIDGSHIFSDIFLDAYYAHLMLMQGKLLVFHDSRLPATRTVGNILVSNFGYVEECDPAISGLLVLRKTHAGCLDWKDFDNQFQPFSVAPIPATREAGE